MGRVISELLVTFLVAVAVPLAYALFGRLFPGREAHVSKSLEELKDEFSKWEQFAIVPLFVLTVLLTCIWYGVMIALAHVARPEMGGDVFSIVPQNEFWLIPALFLGIVSSALPMDLLYRALLQERYTEYDAYSRRKHGIDGWRVLAFFAVIVGIGSGAFMLLGADSYERFTDTEIVVNPLFSWRAERRYGYDMVNAVQQRSQVRAPNGTIREKPHYAIRFADGTEWRTIDDGRTALPLSDQRIIEFVAQRSGKKTEKVTLGSRAP